MDIIDITDVSIIGLIRGAFNLLPILILLVFLTVMIYGGFVRMTASGDPDKEQRSMQILSAGIFGFIIIALSPLIINILGRFLGIDSLLLG